MPTDYIQHLPSIDNVSMKVKGLSCGWRSAVVGVPPFPMTGEGRGIQKWPFWAELLDVWVLNLDPIFIFGEVGSVLFGGLPTHRSRVQSLGPQDWHSFARQLERIWYFCPCFSWMFHSRSRCVFAKRRMSHASPWLRITFASGAGLGGCWEGSREARPDLVHVSLH